VDVERNPEPRVWQGFVAELFRLAVDVGLQRMRTQASLGNSAMGTGLRASLTPHSTQ
jgi:hypothetical protein